MAGDTAGFESYLRGSWWDVQIKRERSSMVELRYTADEDEEGSWVPMTELRLSSRRADAWDCYTIDKGMDVAVLAKHPLTKSLNLEKEGLYDARVSSVARSIHKPGNCSCKFSIRFFDIKLDTFTDGTDWNSLDRILLTDETEIEVSISDIRILQKPAVIPLRDVLDSHLERRWIPLGRGCQDACFLAETELTITTRPRGAFVQDHTDPAQVRSAEVISPSPARVSGKNGERASKCNTPGDGPQPDVHGSKEACGTAEEESRVPKSASGSPGNNERKEAAGNANVTILRNMTIKRECFSAEDHEEDRSNGTVGEGPPVKKGGLPKRERIQSRRKENTRNTVEDTIDIECTQLSSDTSDSETEWKPVTGLKKLPTTPSNIRTRDRTTTHKRKLEEVRRPSLRSSTRSGTRDASIHPGGFKSRR